MHDAYSLPHAFVHQAVMMHPQCAGRLLTMLQAIGRPVPHTGRLHQFVGRGFEDVNRPGYAPLLSYIAATLGGKAAYVPIRLYLQHQCLDNATCSIERMDLVGLAYRFRSKVNEPELT